MTEEEEQQQQQQALKEKEHEKRCQVHGTRVRLFVILSIAAFGNIQSYIAVSNPDLVEVFGKKVLLIIAGLVGTALNVFTAWRAFLDTSASKTNPAAPQDVNITNKPNNPVPVDPLTNSNSGDDGPPPGTE